MAIDWLHFTPGAAACGGALIGTAAGGLVLLNGRIAGISGILGGLLRPRPGDVAWRAAFLLGLLAAPLTYRLAAPLPGSRIDAAWPVLVMAGLLVGFGTRLGGGCTSGHGICGLSRLSPRSMAAVAVFMTSAVATVFVTHHLLPL